MGDIFNIESSDDSILHTYMSIPLPPPWRKIEKDSNVINESPNKPNYPVYLNERTGEIVETHPLKVALDDKNHNSQHFIQINDSNDSKNSKHNLTFYDFRCSWKEAGLFGDVDSFGLTLRFYDDLSTQIKFDGVSGIWLLAKLEVVDCL